MPLIFRLLISATLLLLAATGTAAAGETRFRVTDASGHPVKDAVIFAETGRRPVPAEYVLKQEDLTFDPYVLVVPTGADVAFPNLDRVRHHVYSFSKGNRFELKLYGREEKRTIKFENAGIVAIGCNIHDEMVAYIRVVNSDTFGKTDAAGELTLTLPEGTTSVTAWHPEAKGRDLSVPVPAGGAASIAVTLKVKRSGHAH